MSCTDDASTSTSLFGRIQKSMDEMEFDLTQRVVRMSAFSCFIIGGAKGYVQASHNYASNNVGRKYLSPSDALKRRFDYAIVSFARNGFRYGFRAGLLTGAVFGSTLYLAKFREKYESWYFPAVSSTVSGILALPLGAFGSLTSFGIGLSSGAMISGVVKLYALVEEKSVDAVYKNFRKEYQEEIQRTLDLEKRLDELMEKEDFKWRPSALKELKRRDAEKLAQQDV